MTVKKKRQGKAKPDNPNGCTMTVESSEPGRASGSLPKATWPGTYAAMPHEGTQPHYGVPSGYMMHSMYSPMVKQEAAVQHGFPTQERRQSLVATSEQDIPDPQVPFFTGGASFAQPSNGHAADRAGPVKRPKTAMVPMSSKRVSDTKGISSSSASWHTFSRLPLAPSTTLGRAKSSNAVTGVNRTKTMQALRIDDAIGVQQYMIEKILLLQQQVCKKIAKAWIKGLCPKKQSRFPYNQNIKNEDGELMETQGRMPPWWPSTALVVYKEPDHISRTQRVYLILHLLRLRPTVETVQFWNETNTAPNETHKFRGWTAFLNELTPLTLFGEIGSEPEDKVSRRPGLITELFNIADMEEQFQQGGMDGSTTVAWDPAAARRAIQKADNTCKSSMKLLDYLGLRRDPELPEIVPIAGGKRKREVEDDSLSTTSEEPVKIKIRTASISTDASDYVAVPDVKSFQNDIKMPVDMENVENSAYAAPSGGSFSSVQSDYTQGVAGFEQGLDGWGDTSSMFNAQPGPSTWTDYHSRPFRVFPANEPAHPQFSRLPNDITAWLDDRGVHGTFISDPSFFLPGPGLQPLHPPMPVDEHVPPLPVHGPSHTNQHSQMYENQSPARFDEHEAFGLGNVGGMPANYHPSFRTNPSGTESGAPP